ncbi:MAG: NAD-dependent epimerase/dehydratase family protein, partial [Planctomycetaceae bacterium]
MYAHAQAYVDVDVFAGRRFRLNGGGMTNRREFVKRSVLAGGALGLGMTSEAGAAIQRAMLGARTDEAPAQAINLLILGGTGFTGPHQVRYAVSRGHKVTVFNRGRSEADLPDPVEHLYGDRNTGDLKQLEGRDWDVVIDNPTTLPFWVRDAGQVLQGHTGHYIFISTISVYADTSRAGMDE